MFDSLVDATTGTSGAGALSAWARVESAACARKVAAVAAMLAEAYAASGSADRDQWCLDNFDAVAAHVGATQRITPGAASNQLLIAVALHERFPQVAAIFADGLITYQLVRAVVQRGALVVDPDALRALDALLAEAFGTWGPMSVDKTEKTLDAYVAQVDPHAVRRTETKARSRSVEVSVDEDGSGLATVYATLFAHDAKAFEARLRGLAGTVCPADPRTAEQRRADAIGALANGNDRLACLCGTEDCPAGENPPSTGVVVYVIAGADTIATRRPAADGHRANPADASDGPSTRRDCRVTPTTMHRPRRGITGDVHQAAARSHADRGPHPHPRQAGPPAAGGDDGWPVPTRSDRLPRRSRGDHHPDRPPRASATRTPLPTLEEAGRLHPLPRHDVSLPRLPRTRHELRRGPHASRGPTAQPRRPT